MRRRTSSPLPQTPPLHTPHPHPTPNRPLLHAALRYGLNGAYGVELDPVKCSKADAFIRHVMRELASRGLVAEGAMATPLITKAPVERVESLDPATHAYSFWEGVPRDGKAAFGRLFRTSQSLKAVAVVQRAMRNIDPCLEMQQLGFGPLLLIKSFSVNMSGEFGVSCDWLFFGGGGRGARRK